MHSDLYNYLVGFWASMNKPQVFWQIVVLVICCGLALLADRLVRGRKPTEDHVWRIGQAGLRHMTFPLTALALVLLARMMLKTWMPVNLLSLAVPLLASLAIIRAVFYVLRHTFGRPAWIAPFERLFQLLVWSVVALYILGWLPDMIELLESAHFTVGKQKLDLWMVIQGIGTLMVTLLLALWASGVIETRLMRAEGLDSNLRVVFSRLARALLLVLAVLIVLPLVGIDLTTLSVFGGALGVGLGFGLQKIASNYISGFIILLDRSIRIGNVIAVGNDRGQVTQITTRFTVLKGLNGVEALVPNEVLVGSVVLNESYTDSRLCVVIKVQVGYRSDVEQAMRILADIAKGQPRVLTDPPPTAFVSAFADSGINLDLLFWIGDPQEGTFQVRSDIHLAIWREFKAAGIEIPYPQREVRLLNDSDTG